MLHPKKRLKAPETLKMSLKKSNICIFFHSIWKNLHLTEMSVVSVTNMRYACVYCKCVCCCLLFVLVCLFVYLSVFLYQWRAPDEGVKQGDQECLSSQLRPLSVLFASKVTQAHLFLQNTNTNTNAGSPNPSFSPKIQRKIHLQGQPNLACFLLGALSKGSKKVVTNCKHFKQKELKTFLEKKLKAFMPLAMSFSPVLLSDCLFLVNGNIF